jgi:hypothetical protein
VQHDQGVVYLRSWQLAAEIIGRAVPQLWPICLHPGGGLYDCLYLVDAEGNEPIIINRAGSVHLASGHSWGADQWPTHVERDLRGFLRRINERSPRFRFPALESSPAARSAVARTSRVIAGALALPGMRAEPVWYDSSGDDGAFVDERLLRPYRSAEAVLRELESTPAQGHPRFPPAAWLWALVIDDQPLRLINLRNATSIAPDGTSAALR